MARRIRLRAIERGGELLKQVKPDKGGRPKTEAGTGPSLTRSAVANGAGLSDRQAKTMIRVANIPQAERDTLIESAEPPTVEELAERGTKKKIIEMPPHRDEWADWTIAVRRLGEPPDCGLAIEGPSMSGSSHALTGGIAP